MNYNRSLTTFYKVSEWIMRLSVINLLWIAFNIPIVYMLLHLIMVKNTSEATAIGIMIAILMPFFFFPATASMFAVIRKWFMKEYDISIVRSYWKYYKENYVKSMIGGFILIFIWIVFIVDYHYFTTYLHSFFSYLFLTLFLFLFIFTLHFLSTIAHFESNLFYALRYSLLITIGNPFMTLGLGMANFILIYISIHYINLLIPLFMGSTIAFISFKGFYHVFFKIQLIQKQNQKAIVEI